MHSRGAEYASVAGAGGSAVHAAPTARTAHVDRSTSCSVRPELATIPHASRIAEAASVGIVGMKVYSVGSKTASSAVGSGFAVDALAIANDDCRLGVAG